MRLADIPMTREEIPSVIMRWRGYPPSVMGYRYTFTERGITKSMEIAIDGTQVNDALGRADAMALAAYVARSGGTGCLVG